MPRTNENRITTNEIADGNQHLHDNSNSIGCDIIIDILNDVVLKGVPMTSINQHDLQSDQDHNVKQISFKSIRLKHNLNFKELVAFEIMACSFILKSLTTQNITENALQLFFHENENKQNKYKDCLRGFKKV